MDMLGVGSAGFILFILYDLNQMKKNSVWLKPLFALGCLLIIGSTGMMIGTPFSGDIQVSGFVAVSFMVLSILNLILLIYTLFFAIPFHQAYVEGNKQNLCTEGIYSLSRHPGVLFFFSFYLFLGISLGKPLVLIAGVVFTCLNIFYVFLQDRYFFPVSFQGYDAYKKTTNFIFPSRKSIKSCIRYYI